MTQWWTSDRKDRSSNFKLDLRGLQCGGGQTYKYIELQLHQQ